MLFILSLLKILQCFLDHRKKSISNTLHEWNTSTLRSSVLTNAHIEGDDTTSEARTQTTRLNNVTQIFKNSVAVSDTDTNIAHAVVSGVMANEMLKVLKEQKLDVEKTLFSNQSKVAGNTTTARKMAGAATWVTTNVNFTLETVVQTQRAMDQIRVLMTGQQHSHKLNSMP